MSWLKYIYILLLMLFPVTQFAQERLVVKNLTSKSNDSLICYTGIYNRLTMFVEGPGGDTLPGKNIFIFFDDSGIMEFSSREHNVTYTDLWYDNPGYVRQGIMVNDERKYVDCYVRRHPDLYAALNRQRDSIMTKSKLMAFLGVGVFYPDINFNYRPRVTSFKLRTVIGYDSVVIENQGALFNNTVKDAISRVNPGDVVLFDDIRLQCPDGRAMRLKNFAIQVL